MSLVPHALAILLYGLSAIAGAAPLDEPLKPLPEIPKQNPAQVELGRRLFSDPRLSVNNTLSCASCHQLDKSGADTLSLIHI